jgi:glycosyltransferase involved in cell wall biosynthesis
VFGPPVCWFIAPVSGLFSTPSSPGPVLARTNFPAQCEGEPADVQEVLLSIVLPAYNEELRIGRALDEVAEYCRSSDHDVEVIVVDDGSSDALADVAREYSDEIAGLQVIQHETNRGKGRAVATGMLAATGVYRAFLDADGATPVGEIDKLLEIAAKHPLVIPIGSIRAAHTEPGRRQPLLRTLAGRAGNAVIRSLVLPGVADSQRGCKLFPGAVADAVFGAQQVDGWAFDIEILALCQRLGYEIREVPVRWDHIDGGQIRAGSYVSTLGEVWRIRRLLRSGAHHLVPTSERPAALRRQRA